MDKIAKPERYRPRIVDGLLETHLKSMGAVLIEGPKQCGKTWTASMRSESEFDLASPNRNFNNRNLAMLNPLLALEGETPHLIDEWQEVPLIWDAVRGEVDRRGKKGQFILTGSSSPTRKGVIHPGTGRISTLRMHTMSLFETGDSDGRISLGALFKGKTPEFVCKEKSLRELARFVVRGGFPDNLSPEADPKILPKAYVDSLRAHDIVHDGKTYDRRLVGRLLKSLARNVSTTVNDKTLIADCLLGGSIAVNYAKLDAYLGLLESMFVTEDQPPFVPNVRSEKRIRLASKRHLCDSALAASLLGLDSDGLLADIKTFGFLFESLAVHDLRVYGEAIGASIYHYRDFEDFEVDAILELANGDYGAIEIKLGDNSAEAAATSLLRFADKMERNGARRPVFMMVLCGLCAAAYLRPDGVYVAPLTSLRN